ncbi:MAG: hypothetical protein KDK63_00120 [Chlamydiia bacterium]|nr:hypothetical protein [Chlamydiia bacterium]MCB1115745.1 hypothetical protein [Chlamydiia bacterium]
MEKAKAKEVLKGEIQAFLCEFEASEESIDDMKTLVPIWRDKLLNHAHDVGGGIEKQIRKFLYVCEDYASNRGMLERVRMEGEETRLHLGL